MATILVVDDELGIRALLTEILSDEGHTVEAAEDAASARVLRERLQPDLVLLDIWMPDVDGITLLKEWNSAGQLTMPVIMMSGHGTIDTAVEAMKFGAAAFLEKPVTLQKLLRAVEEGLNRGVDPRGAPGAGAAGLGGANAAAAGAAAGLGKAVPGHPAAAMGAAPVRGTAAGAPGHAGAEGAEGSAWAAGPGVNSLADTPAHAGALGTVASGSQQSFELDRPLRNLRIGVRKATAQDGEPRGDADSTRISTRTRASFTEIRALEATPLLLQEGNLLPLPQGGLLGPEIRWEELQGGVALSVRLSAEQVILDVDLRDDTIGAAGVRKKTVRTTVSGRLGEWIRISDVDRQNAPYAGPGDTSTGPRDADGYEIRVELLP